MSNKQQQQPNSGGIQVKIVHLDADTDHSLGMLQTEVVNGIPLTLALSVGGYSKTMGVAKGLLPSFLEKTGKPTDPYGGWNVEEACELALAAAGTLIRKAELRAKILNTGAEPIQLAE